MSTSNELLRLDAVNFSFDVDMHRAWNFRDLFVEFFKKKARSKSPKVMIANNINLRACKGERIALLGTNGTGKTSLCRCIAGIYNPTSGKIYRAGKVRSVFNSGVGIQPELTGRENAELLVELLYPREPDKRQILEEALEFSELGDFVDAPFRVYSNGMRARLTLPIVSALPADIFILDEVFAGADSNFAQKMALRMVSIIENSGMVLFVSHSLQHIRLTCNRVLVLDRGEIAFDGDVEQGIRYYQSVLDGKRHLPLTVQ